MLRDRLKTAGYLIPPALLVLYLGGTVLGVVALVIYTILNYEYFRLATKRDNREVIQLVALALLIPGGYLTWGWGGMCGAIFLAIMLALVLEIIITERSGSDVSELNVEQSFPPIATGLLYTGVLGSLLVVLAFEPRSGRAFWWLLMTVFLGDTGAYFGGRHFGGRKLSPRISPHKTVSGALCGLASSVAGSVLAGMVVGTGLGLTSLIAFGLLAGILAQIGDLVESLIKRCFEVKDSGTLLPGHGGLLDRLDGVLFSAGVLFFLQL